MLLVTTLAGCAATDGVVESVSPSQTPPLTASADPAQANTILVLGDSIPYNSPDYCPGCTSFPDALAELLTEAGDEAFVADNRSRYDGARTSDILDEVKSGSLDEPLAAATIVIVSAGYNDQPPYATDGAPCFSGPIDSDDDAIAGVVATTSECIGTQTATVREQLAAVLEESRAKAPEATILALTSYDSWLGWEPLNAQPPEVRAQAEATIRESLDAWRTAVCEEAANVEGACVDLLEGFNGADGMTPAGALLAGDYTHPSQEGNDRIAELVVAALG